MAVTPDNAAAHYNLGGAFFQRGEWRDAAQHFGEAERESVEAIRLDPDQTDAHLVLAKVRLEQGQTEQAEQHFATIMRLNPNAAQTQLRLGTFSMRRGRFAEAIDHFRTALRLQPDLVEARDALARLNATDRDPD